MNPKQSVREYLDGFHKLAERLEAGAGGHTLPLEEGIMQAIEIVRPLRHSKGKLFFVGNGGSAGIVSHLAVDFWKMGGMRSMVFSDPAFLTCISNDYGYAHVYEKPIESFTDQGDVLIAISSSGQSENILRAAKAAQKGGAKVITLSGFEPKNPLRALGDVNFYVPSHAYNYVETLHMLLCVSILDCMLATQNPH
jgi:D-sedoheptulose 7-phosphate isomerase